MFSYKCLGIEFSRCIASNQNFFNFDLKVRNFSNFPPKLPYFWVIFTDALLILAVVHLLVSRYEIEIIPSLLLYGLSWWLRYGCESWTVKKAECWRIDALELWCWRRLLRVSWTARRSNQSLLKEINWIFIGRTDTETEAPILWPPDSKSWLTGKDPHAGTEWSQEEKGTTEDEMVGWHHRLNGHEFEQAVGDGEGQGSLLCCSPWGFEE